MSERPVQSHSERLTSKGGLVWFDLEASAFDPATKALIETADKARKAAAIATAACDKAIKAKRLLTAQGEPIQMPGEELIVSHRFGKLTCASAVPMRKAASKNQGVVA